jgi:hypothetical protein
LFLRYDRLHALLGFVMRRRRIAILVPVVLLTLLAIVSKPVVLLVAKHMIENRLARLEGIKVAVGAITSGVFDGITLEKVTVALPSGAQLVSAEKIKVDFSLVDLALRRVGPWEIDVSKMVATISSSELKRLKEVAGKKGVSSQIKSKVTHEIGISLPYAIHLDGKVEVHLEGYPAIVFEDCVLDASRQTKGVGGDIYFTLLVQDRTTSHARGRFSLQSSGFSTEVRFDSPLKLLSIKDDELLSPFEVSGFAVDYENGVFTFSALDVLSLSPIGRKGLFLDAIGIKRLSLSAKKETFPDLLSSKLSAVDSIFVVDGAFKVDTEGTKLTNLEIRHLNATIENKEAVILQVDGEIRKDNSTFSKFRMSSSVDTESLTFDANGAVEGDFLVHLAHAFHQRFLAWPRSSISVSFSAKGSLDEFSVSGHMSGRSLAYFWTKLCLVPIYPFDFDIDFALQASPKKGTLRLSADPVDIGASHFALTADVKSLREPLIFTLKLTVPKQPCDSLFRSIPPVLVPRLDGAIFDGRLAAEIELIVDKQKLERSKLNVSVDHEECRAVTLGTLVDVEKLNSAQFVHRIVEEDLKDPILVGPGTDSYVPIEDIPFHVQQAALATEDMAFFKHEGFRIGLINRAIRLNLDYGWYVYGGSTISQQLVKNLFLSSEKTLARKLEEAIIVWEMEKKVEKERILELYLNCIEFGKHIYGIKAAAMAYFNKEPKDLTPLEAAFIMATKPAPRYAFGVYKSRKFNKWWVERMQGILTRLWKEMQVLDEEQATTPDLCPPGSDQRPEYLIPCFYYPEEDAYMTPEVEADFVRPEGMPKALPGGEKTEETQNNPQ